MTQRVHALIAANPALNRLASSHLPRPVQPEDVAAAVLFLASDEARAITGQVSHARREQRLKAMRMSVAREGRVPVRLGPVKHSGAQP